MELIIIDNKQYDISSWKLNHPGGDLFSNYIGEDCTSLFKAYHPIENNKISKILKKLEINEKTYETNNSEISEEYLKLNKFFIENNFYKINKKFYLLKYFLILFLLITSFLTLGIYDFISGILFGLVIQQSAFIGHDLGHNQIMNENSGYIFNKKYKKYAALFFGNFLFGVDGINWSHNHDIHHVLTLMPGKDLQNDHLPFILYKKEEITWFPERKLNFLLKLLLRIQHIYVLPILFIVGKINLFFDLDNRLTFLSKNYLRTFGLFSHLMLWYYFITNAKIWYLFFIPAWITASMIHLQIIISHAYMPRISDFDLKKKGWIETQTITTVDIATTWYDEWFHGGLQYQLAHHLYPRIPRHNLKKARPFIIEFCKKNKLNYIIEPFSEAIYKMILSMKESGKSI